MISQIIERVGRSKKGSITAVAVSGITTMSPFSIFEKPAIEEPSTPTPCLNSSGFSADAGTVI